ncbi:MAG: diacylglycerol kinase family lipid kinase [Eggerthellaceae bacterium]|nr:diacylglycerol kinase family lipid kinase [Eggerthellaceae bacterium]
MPSHLGSTLIIANPVSQNGKGRVAAEHACRLLSERMGKSAPELALTEYPRHAAELAANAASYDTVLALGGDGLIHEVANGLMRIDEAQRPALGLLPVGSGNDYAASLGVSGKLEKAIDQLFSSQVLRADVGVCNGEYFVETVSFGLDAAIALDTVERRVRTGRTGTALYFAAGIDQLLHHLDLRPYRVILDGAREIEGQMYLLAVQNGQTYGGGFKVCPQAALDDGALDVCIAHPPLNSLSATLIFVLAKEGFHRRFKQIRFEKAKQVRLEFESALPAQIDGELLEGTTFDLSIVPRALRVLAPSSHSYSDPAGSGYVRVEE